MAAAKFTPLSWKSLACYSSVILFFVLKSALAATEEIKGGEKEEPGRYPVVRLNYEHVADIYAYTMWIMLGSMAKVAFHMSSKFTEKLPESCLLIILGLGVGAILYAANISEQRSYVLNADTFFLFLLPPIILEAGYFMPNRPFFDNIGTILLFAVGNTLFNIICIGFTIWGFSHTPIYGGVEFEWLHCFLFASIISAVDPVAVLATFAEIHVNDMLYIIVFGESLLNDAVSVVLYNLFSTLSEIGKDKVQVVDFVLGGVAFLISSLGGTAIGIIFGVVACYTTKFTANTPVLEPLIIITYAYLSYLTAEMFEFSSILAITFCGIFMRQYVEYNIAKKSSSTTEYVLKILASIAETIIFVFIGFSAVSNIHAWNTGFVFITLICVTLYRIIGVVIFAKIANLWRLLELSMTDMLIMSYGGIRGAVAFALVLRVDESIIPRKKEFVTTTLFIVLWTVFVQGATIGPLVKFFKVKRKEEEEPVMCSKLSVRTIDHVMTFMEKVAGVHGNHEARNSFRKYDQGYLKPLLLREQFLTRDDKLLKTFNQINETNVNKIVEQSEFLLHPVASISQLSKNSSLESFTISNNTTGTTAVLKAPPKLAVAKEDAEFYDLLDSVMSDPRKRRGSLASKVKLRRRKESIESESNTENRNNLKEVSDSKLTSIPETVSEMHIEASRDPNKEAEFYDLLDSVMSDPRKRRGSLASKVKLRRRKESIEANRPRTEANIPRTEATYNESNSTKPRGKSLSAPRDKTKDSNEPRSKSERRDSSTVVYF